jgi:hypothetical protein
METDPRPRPRDMALLLLAAGGRPPRLRARDQRPDQLGGNLRCQVLQRLAALDPEPGELPAALASIVAELGEPSGPPRAVAALLLEEWQASQRLPGYWDWLLREALDPPRSGGRRTEAGDVP